MSIKAGTFLHDANGFVIDRIQTGGVSSLNIPSEKIYELGNYQTVATIFDIPELTFDVESFDVSTEVEAILHGKAPGSVVDGDEFSFATTYPIDVISPFKAGNGQYNIVKGLAIPYLTLDTVTYNAAVKQNMSEQFTLRGDSIYYIPGTPYYQEFTLVNNQLTYTLDHTALPYVESGNTLYALSACVKNVSTGAYKRLFFGTDSNGYTNTSTTITTISDWFDAGYTKLHVTYGSSTAATYSQSVHQAVADTTPAAVRAKDILLYVGAGGTATSSLVRWSGVQSFNVSRRVNLESDEEFGNSKYVATDYDTADVNGSITVRSADINDLFTLIQQVTGTTSSEISGPLEAPSLELMVQVRAATGAIIKTWNIPDARFTIPGPQGRVQTKLDVQFPFTSDGGLLSVYKGDIN